MNRMPSGMGAGPIMQMLEMARSGKNPMQLLGQMAGQNPYAASALRLMQGKSPQELRQTVENMARERGTDLGLLAQQLGLRLPKQQK